MRTSVLLVICTFTFFRMEAQSMDTTTVDDFYQMSLEEILEAKISVDSKFEYKKKESPSVNTVITSEEIMLMGARNLIDILQTVPGLSVSVGGIPYYGVNIRGNASNFGKILILLDGEPLNESMYGFAHIGDRINVNQIERIEIIQGPGSALYGSWAEYGVISIITKKNVSGVSFGAGLDEYQLTYKGGAYVNENSGPIKLTGSMYSGMAEIRKDTTYSVLFDTSYFMSVYRERPLWITAGISYKNFYVKYLVDAYKVDFSSPHLEVRTNSDMYFSMDKVVLGYEHNLNYDDKLSIKVDFTRHNPYNLQVDNQTSIAYKNQSNRIQILYNKRVGEKLSLIQGIEAQYDFGRYENNYLQQTFQGSYSTISGFLSAEYRLKNFLTTAGFRYTYNTVYKSAFSPRLSMRYNLGMFYAKAMFNYAYRPPAIGELLFIDYIDPETTTSYEIQAGLDKPNLKASLSYYNLLSKNTISYAGIVNMNAQTLQNRPQTGTEGIEGEFRYVFHKRLSLMFNFSQVLRNFNEVEDYDAGGGYNIGLPLTTGYFRTSYMVLPDLYITPGYQYIGKIKAINAGDENENINTYDPVHLFNCNVSFSQRRKDMRITYSLGVYNILYEKQYFHTPYNSLGSSYAANQRQVVISLHIEF